MLLFLPCTIVFVFWASFCLLVSSFLPLLSWYCFVLAAVVFGSCVV